MHVKLNNSYIQTDYLARVLSLHTLPVSVSYHEITWSV